MITMLRWRVRCGTEACVGVCWAGAAQAILDGSDGYTRKWENYGQLWADNVRPAPHPTPPRPAPFCHGAAYFDLP
jgi:hypothetical protein